jgi:hypothetical protein
MRDESYSFIWQPKVLIKTFLGAVALVRDAAEFFLVGFISRIQGFATNI